MLYTCTCMSISTLVLNCTGIVRPLKVNRDLPPKGKLEVYFFTLLTLIHVHVQCTCNLKYNYVFQENTLQVEVLGFLNPQDKMIRH